MPGFDVTIKTVPAMLVAARRMTTRSNGGVPMDLGAAFTETYDYVRRLGAQDDGPCLALWHGLANSFGNKDAEALVPIDRRLAGTDRIKIYELSKAQVACIMHYGYLKEFTQDHAAVLAWINGNGYKIVGPYREIYMNPDRTITEIQFPIEKA